MENRKFSDTELINEISNISSKFPEYNHVKIANQIFIKHKVAVSSQKVFNILRVHNNNSWHLNINDSSKQEVKQSVSLDNIENEIINHNNKLISQIFSDNMYKLFVKFCNKKGYKFLSDFQEFDFNKLYSIPSLGVKKINSIIAIFEKNKPKNLSKPKPISIKEIIATKPVCEETLAHFPLFSNRSFDLTIEPIHESYKINDSLQNLSLTPRSRHSLQIMNINTVGELLYLMPDQIIRIKNCGKKTIADLQEDVRKYLLTKDTDLSSSWLSFDTMIKSIIKISDRNLHIFKNRLGIGLNSPQTLDDSGSSFGLTRERTRQILSSIQKKLNTNINNNLLMPFWLAVDLVLDNYQGLIYSNDIATEITDLLGWYTAIEGHAIIAFSELTNKYFIDKEYQLICNKDDNCLDCLFREDFLNHISYSFDKFVISDLIHDYHENYCSNCKHYNSTKLISEGQVKYQLHKTDFSRFYVFHEGSYYSHSKFEEKKKKDRRKQLRENHSAKILFEDFLNSLPCYASQDEIQAFLLKNGLNFDYGLASLLQRSEDVYSWGRGLYIHKSKVYISDELAIELKNYITQNLDNKNQYLAIQKVFNENKELCIDQNIPNKIALYTVLSLSLSHYFQFPGSPLITSLSNKYPQSLPILLEHYILSFEKGIEYHNVKNYFVNVIGISFRSFRFQISNNPAIFKLQKDILIHKKYIINIDEENNISQFVEALLSKGKLSEFALQNHLEESGVIKSLSVSLSSLIANNKNIDTSNDILSLNANSLFYYLNESEIKSNISNLNFIGLDNESIRDYLVSELIIQNDKVLIFEDENPLDDILSEFG